ncbi:imidazole glycerol phosphate synthase subunit HisH [Pseudodesulfovibrio sediminis]|uniref:Imidazole glycerol phosphate synthase subunit HisH n=1 Tax=Pseudodesulfovibrio sediminis TaxID=2810563 RepID=A0ABM7P3X2_9BACT|nr:imidazole glycerol phosphate synthase subunit HisH [Pseudodesulfovibrio sediminis]BCS87550.1 imidazole glycerol phosphate synthase subunit HisH [Pseudodesulfovibrio sediminis]
MNNIDVAIIDYGLGNLFSIKHACEHVGLSVQITDQSDAILSARSVILPGVGAFGDAIDSLNRLDLVSPIKDVAAKGTPLLGICLGQQLLFTESEEFGTHKGLDLISGQVQYFPVQKIDGRTYKVPQVGWNAITPPNNNPETWKGTLLEGVTPGTNMYFVHSCHVVPDADDAVLTRTTYGNVDFCSASHNKNITAFQFHPERSGTDGLIVYTNFANLIRSSEAL